MDFASLMKSQIAASKNPGSGEGKKYLKRSEVEAQRQEAYQKEQEEAERARIERLEKKRKRDDEEAEQKAEREEKKARLAIESKRIREEEEEAGKWSDSSVSNLLKPSALIRLQRVGVGGGASYAFPLSPLNVPLQLSAVTD